MCVRNLKLCLASSSPSAAPPEVASVETNTAGLDDTGVGHPQSAPDLTGQSRLEQKRRLQKQSAIFVIVFFIFKFFCLVCNIE
jgi:hypothetical protein